jgi:2-polyprenyl-3-methyl-5-hydroxy-6-metoxy-1,4-benzoquinol methylase
VSPDDTSPEVFDAHVEAWRDYVATPWARIRYAVVADVLDRHVLDLVGGSAPLQVLDFGGGDGLDSVPLAASGHQVTIVDSSPAMLELAMQRAASSAAANRVRGVCGGVEQLRGGGGAGDRRYDLALCHFVIQYVADPGAVVSDVVGALRPGGLMSLIAPNPVSDVLTKAIREVDPRGALAVLDAPTVRAVTFEHDVNRIGAEDGRKMLEAAGCSVIGHYGVRSIIDLIPDHSAKWDPDQFAEIERLERRVVDRSPYRDIARAWQFVARLDN